MKIIMNDKNITTISQIEAFLLGSQDYQFETITRAEAYQWIENILTQFSYFDCGKKNKSLVRQYIARITGYSKAQIDRFVKEYKTRGLLTINTSNRPTFPGIYTDTDIQLLAETDKLHERLSGPVTRKLFQRAYHVFDDKRYERLSKISSAHIYNLRESLAYREVVLTLKKTQPVKNSIGVRRAPEPNGRPGFIRIDTVHQGDNGKIKGLYHINAVDDVTQWQVDVTVEKIDKEHLVEVLKILLLRFPFVIIELHADNGGEYINHKVAELLNELLITLTKSRPRKSNDNALIECKNGWTIRKHFGYTYIDIKFVPLVNVFIEQFFEPYLNFHRPCYFPTLALDKKGRLRKCYRPENIMTPYNKLKSLDNAAQYLRPEVTFEQLDKLAMACSDEEAARIMQHEKEKMWETIRNDQTE